MENKKRLIDADVLLAEVEKSKLHNPHPQGMVRVNHRNEHDHFERMILDAPTVDAAPVVHGYWEDYMPYVDEDPNNKTVKKRCSVCKESASPFMTKYCAECGAKMDGGNEDG